MIGWFNHLFCCVVWAVWKRWILSLVGPVWEVSSTLTAQRHLMPISEVAALQRHNVFTALETRPDTCLQRDIMIYLGTNIFLLRQRPLKHVLLLSADLLRPTSVIMWNELWRHTYTKLVTITTSVLLLCLNRAGRRTHPKYLFLTIHIF